MSEIIFIEEISEEDFSKIKDEWNSLLERSVNNEIFLTWEWIYSWWINFKSPQKKLLILIGRDKNAKLIGIAPFYKEEIISLKVFKKRVIRFSSSIEVYPDHLDLICEKGFEKTFSRAVFEYIIKKEKDWHEIKLEGIEECSIIKRFILEEINKLNNFIIETFPESECPYLKIEGSFGDYLNSFPRKKRYNIQREKKILLEKENIIFQFANNNNELQKYFDKLVSLHKERAQKKKIKSNFLDSNSLKFHKDLITHLSERGKATISILSKGDNLYASCYCLINSNKYYYYQTGLSSEGESKGAGSVLLSMMIEKAFNEGFKEFDFLRGQENYKYYWTKDSRRNYLIIIRRKNIFSFIYQKYYKQFKNWKKIIKYLIN